MTQQNKAYIYAIAAVGLWSTVASAFKLSLAYFDPLRLLLFATATSLLALLVIVLVQKKLRYVLQQSYKELSVSAAMGALNPFLYYVVLFEAYDRLPAQEALTLNYSWVITVALFSSLILKQRLKPTSLAGLVLSFCGVIVIATHGNPFELKFSDTVGVILAAGSSLIWGLYWVLNLRDRRDTVVKLLLNFSFGFIFTGIAVLTLEGRAAVDLRGLLGAAYIGLFEMGITFVLWLMALKLSATAARVGSLAYLSPFMSLFFINLTVGENISPSALFGLVLIIGGILIFQYISRKKRQEEILSSNPL